MAAVASAMPSINPTATAPAPSTLTMNTGNSAWIISEETSMHRLTPPSTQTVRGSRLRLSPVVMTFALHPGCTAHYVGAWCTAN